MAARSNRPRDPGVRRPARRPDPRPSLSRAAGRVADIAVGHRRCGGRGGARRGPCEARAATRSCRRGVAGRARRVLRATGIARSGRPPAVGPPVVPSRLAAVRRLHAGSDCRAGRRSPARLRHARNGVQRPRGDAAVLLGAAGGPARRTGRRPADPRRRRAIRKPSGSRTPACGSSPSCRSGPS